MDRFRFDHLVGPTLVVGVGWRLSLLLKANSSSRREVTSDLATFTLILPGIIPPTLKVSGAGGIIFKGKNLNPALLSFPHTNPKVSNGGFRPKSLDTLGTFVNLSSGDSLLTGGSIKIIGTMNTDLNH